AYALLYVTKGRFLKAPFERLASRSAGRAVSVGGDFQLYLNPNIVFVAGDLRVANPDWARDDALFAAKSIDLELGLWRLLFGEQRYRHLNIDQGRIGLERDAQGRVSWSFDPAKPLQIPAIDRAAITGTKLRYRDARRRIDLDVSIGDVAASAAPGQGRIAAPLTFAGSGTAMAAPFSLRGALTTPNTTLAGGRTGLDLQVGVADTKITVTGTLAGATRLDGADLEFSVAGRNLQTPFALLGITVPATRPYRIGAHLTKAGNEFRFPRSAGRFGDSDIAGTLTMARPQARLRLDGKLASQTLDILDVGPWLGYSPAAIEAKGGKGLITVKAGRPTILPDAPLDIAGLAGFDAHIAYTAARVRTGNAAITALAADLTLDDRKLTLAPLAFDLSGGRLTANITLNARVTPVVTDYDIALSQVALGRLLTAFDVENSGTTASVRGRLQLRGYGDTVHKSLSRSNGRIALVFPSGTLWVRNIQLAKLDLQNFLAAFFKGKLKKPTSIRCGLVAF
ncbi:MAG: AsmA family protein, partial [Polymorphobacter sp.]